MRHVLLATLLVGTCFGQELRLDKVRPSIPQNTLDASKYDPTAPQISVEVRFISATPELARRL
ncbi:MAG: hypothetical protein AB8G99_13660, partial [Planctomycetaceae bacterium]